VVTFADGFDVEEGKGESGLSTEGGRDVGSNFLRLDGVTGQKRSSQQSRKCRRKEPMHSTKN
jgi:hypothetical protein